MTSRRVYFLASAQTKLWKRRPNGTVIDVAVVNFANVTTMHLIDSVEDVSSVCARSVGLDYDVKCVKFQKGNELVTQLGRHKTLVVEKSKIFTMEVDSSLWKRKSKLMEVLIANRHDWKTIEENVEEEVLMDAKKKIVGGATRQFILLANVRLDFGNIEVKQYNKFEIHESLIKEDTLTTCGMELLIGRDLVEVPKESVGTLDPKRVELEGAMKKRTLRILYQTDDLSEERLILPLDYKNESMILAYQVEGFSNSGNEYGQRTFRIEDLIILD